MISTCEFSTKDDFDDLLSSIQEAKPSTLAIWRLSNKSILDILKAFAAEKNDDRIYERFALKTQDLFDRLNSLLAEQERNNYYFSPTLSITNYSRKNEFSVIFGGKYATTPQSIPESLVSRLVNENPRIYTVSRSNPTNVDLPLNLRHFQSELLTDVNLGKGEFLKILNTARDEWQKWFSKTTKLVIYFTLGFYKGENPFMKNMITAGNFREALLESFADLDSNSWRVVVTGTDATRPSTYKDDTFEHRKKDKSGKKTKKTLLIPSYKIEERNYAYALSKLGQFYVIANAVMQLTGTAKRRRRKVESILKKVHTYVNLTKEGGNSFDYLVEHSTLHLHSTRASRLNPFKRLKKEETGKKSSSRSVDLIAELNLISRYLDRLETSLQDNFMVVRGISICYTPLHAKPWSENALKCTTMTPRLFVLKQIMPRLKNAISIEQAVALHFPRHRL